MIREDRDPEFWSSVYEHPEVKSRSGFGQEIDMAAVVANPAVIPLRSERGGFLFVRLEGLGRIFELHTMFLPDAWGSREILTSAKEAFTEIFGRGAQVVTTYEVAGNPRSQPPRTFRFAPAGDFQFAPILGASLRTWVLTRAAWDAAPARLRMRT